MKVKRDGEWVDEWPPRIPDEVQQCKALGHRTQERNLDPTQHGYDTLVFCDVCGYEYHVDSSD